MPSLPASHSEIVEDSEPEREAWRQAQKLERRKKKLASVPVVVIPDGSAPATPSRGRSPPIRVIEISDSSTSSGNNVISINTTSASDVVECLDEPQPLVTPASHLDDEEMIPTLNLAHFAFASSRPLQPRNSASSLGSSLNEGARTNPMTKPVARNASKHLGGEFSDAELNKLVKCISCDIAWTTRKTAAQKLVHIKSCSKKNGLTDDTVGFLIKKAAENAPKGTETSKSKGDPHSAVTATSTTLLEDVVREAAPKRKGKRKEPTNALKSVSETRENILGRAQVLFGPGPISDSDSFVVQTQAVRADALAAEHERAPTQAFGTSRLAQRQTHKPSLLGAEDSDGEPDLLPSTQAFAPSKLGGRTAAGSAARWGYESESENDSAAVASPNARPSSPLHLSPSSTKDASPRLSLQTRHKMNAPDLAFAPQVPWNDDDHDAYVHYNPSQENGGQNNNSSSTLDKLKKNKNTKYQGQISGESDAAPPVVQKKRRSKKKIGEEFDQGWELALKEKILADNELHLRILRYEPINFEAFLQLVTEDTKGASGRLKLSLRTFLDKQAINFYEGEGGSRARTKRR